MTAVQPGAQQYSTGLAGGQEPANLGDILERVLDKGLVIVGDIRVSLLDIELLTIKLRLLIASVETARELGIDWWESDPWLRSAVRERELTEQDRSELEELEAENRQLRDRLAALESEREPRPVTAGRQRARQRTKDREYHDD